MNFPWKHFEVEKVGTEYNTFVFLLTFGYKCTSNTVELKDYTFILDFIDFPPPPLIRLILQGKHQRAKGISMKCAPWVFSSSSSINEGRELMLPALY